MRQRISLFSLAAMVGLGLLFSQAGSLYAQGTQSTILGTITDASAASVAGAEVTVRNEGTNIERKATTNATGDYRIGGLEPGLYEVTIANPGFRTYKTQHIVLRSAQLKRIDAQLAVGDVATTITVEGNTSQVETETATLSNVKPSRDFQQLPLSVWGRSPFNVTNVVAGIQGSVVNGARNTANNYTTDGVSVGSTIYGTNSPNGFLVDADTIQELKVMTANNSAEYAQVSQFQAVSKSGTNQLHGTFYWSNFNQATSARSWQSRTKPSALNYNIFSLNNGGPVYIPKVYDGRNKTFYFFSWGGARLRSGSRKYIQVPTPAFRQGDFSGLLADSIPAGQRVVITDPLNNGVPFPNNALPSNRLSPLSRKFQDMVYPDPNRAGIGVYGLSENYYKDPGHQYDADNMSIRVDQKISNSNNLFFRFADTINNKDRFLGALNGGYGQGVWKGNTKSAVALLSDTWTISPNMLNEVRFAFNRTNGAWVDPNLGPNVVSELGLAGIGCSGSNYDPAKCGMPAFSFGGQGGSFRGTSTWANGNHQIENDHELIDNFSWFRGRHSLKFGLDLKRFYVNDRSAPQSMRGSFSFDDRMTGYSYSNFLLGWPSYAQRSIARPNLYPLSWDTGVYAQDSIKITPKATLNIGLRYEYQTPWVEKYDHMMTFDPRMGGRLVVAGKSLPNDMLPEVVKSLPIISAVEAGYPVRSLIKPVKDNIDPRIGLAIRPFGGTSTVIRLGWGLYNQIWIGNQALFYGTSPWSSRQEFWNDNPEYPSVTLPDPFKTVSASSGVHSVTGRNPYFPTTRTQQWNVSFGRELPGRIALDVAYVGTSAKRLTFTQDLNLLHPSTELWDPARRPYQRFGTAGLIQSGASSIYHGLNITADRKVTNGLWFNINYTLTKSLSDVSLTCYTCSAQQNQYQRYLERADDPSLHRQQLRFSYIYQLPFGRGKQFLGDLGRITNGLMGGWQFAGITTMYTGSRLSPGFSGTDPANTNQFSGRPDRIADGNLNGDMRARIKSGQSIFDKSAFVRPETGRGHYGNSARDILTGPGLMLWNISLSKHFTIRERARMEIMWQLFNAFNRPNFYNPSRNIQSGRFGIVSGARAPRRMIFAIRINY